VIRLSFLGRSGSGKTTLIERLLPHLAARGLAVVVVKHAHHRGIELEPAGKDTRRFREAGAAGVALVAPDQLFVLEPRSSEPTLDEVLRRLPRADLVIVESWHALELPFVEVIGDSGERVAPLPRAARLALVGEDRDVAPVPDVPRFGRDEVEPIAAWLAALVAAGGTTTR
jgi:molybdopterin-guanine dinucleotide biosynthesis protein B